MKKLMATVLSVLMGLSSFPTGIMASDVKSDTDILVFGNEQSEKAHNLE